MALRVNKVFVKETDDRITWIENVEQKEKKEYVKRERKTEKENSLLAVRTKFRMNENV
jgi:hypothetical protein